MQLRWEKEFPSRGLKGDPAFLLICRQNILDADKTILGLDKKMHLW